MTPHAYDVLCFSHLRWDFTFQRPNHLMSRFAKGSRVFYIEEPVPSHDDTVALDVTRRSNGLHIVVPRLPDGLATDEAAVAMRMLIDNMLSEWNIAEYVLWYYTPMALPISSHLAPRAVVYDCMDELSLFKGAPPELIDREQQLIATADVMFTGGRSLFEAKRHLHPNIHAFPSSIDVDHFAAARCHDDEPGDQREIGRPRIGYVGVVDERIDMELLREVARERPDWHLVLVGPVVKIDPSEIPSSPNVHHLGPKQYAELPAYLARWDVAMMPFARNDATRFISPTKTPEYLAAGRPVVSTSIRDVVTPYGDEGLVEIADTPETFVAAVERLLALEDRGTWLERVDAFLARSSWDDTWSRMRELVDQSVARRHLEQDELATTAIRSIA
jgi:UDP-galactopyranose mutase